MRLNYKRERKLFYLLTLKNYTPGRKRRFSYNCTLLERFISEKFTPAPKPKLKFTKKYTAKQLFEILAKTENLKDAIDVWKKIVDVQQHFNDIELRIRNYALTIFTATIAGIGFLEKSKIEFRFSSIFGKYISY